MMDIPGHPSDAPPLLTVGMSVYNAGDFLREAVLSVVRQTFCDWELLLLDDGSTDGAVEGIADIADPRIRVIRDGENHGLAARLNQAVSLARGKYFARMDQDDICHPERFERQLAYLAAHPETDLLGTKCVTIDEAGEISGSLPFAADHEDLCRRPWTGFYIPHPTWMGPVAWFKKHGYASPGPYFCEDQELLLRSHKDSRFHVLSEPLLAYRMPGRWRWGKRLRTRTTLLRIQVAHFAARGELLFALLAVLATVTRIFRDLFAAAGLAGRSTVQELEILGESGRFLKYWRSFGSGCVL